MTQLGKILTATDFSANAMHAEARSAMLCRELGLDNLSLLHVYGSALDDMFGLSWKDAAPDAGDAAAVVALEKLARVKERLREQSGIEISAEARAGDSVAEILGMAEAQSVGLIAIGDSSRTAVGKLLGTTSSRLIRRSSVPVLLVRQVPLRGYQNVLVAVDLTAASLRLARLALEIAPEAHISFLHAYSVWAEGKMRLADVDRDIIDSYRGRYARQAREELNAFVQDLDCESRSVTRVVKDGDPVPVIAKYAEDWQPDLIVLGSHGGSLAEEYLMGTITRRVVDDTRCDVLVVPAGEQEPQDDASFMPAA